MSTSPAVPTLPQDPSALTRLRVGLQCLMILKDDPANVDAGQLVNVCFEGEAFSALAESLRQTEDGRQLLTERPSLQGPDLDLDALSAMPEGSLGRAFAQYFANNGIQPFVTSLELRDDVDFIAKRYRETHDIYHLITGYGTDVVGEMELQAFAMGNLGVKSPRVILPFGYLSMGPMEGRWMGPVSYLKKLRAAFEAGRRAPSFINIRFEERWEMQVSALRQLLLSGEAEQAAA